MRGEFIGADRAAEIGLYNKVVEDVDALDSLAQEWAEGLAAGPGLGLAVTKRMLNAEAHMELGEAMQKEGWVQAECMKHPDYKNIIDGFNIKKADKEKSGEGAK
jgi:2-(1,2-epoxy-1,2-dihydrophenyl)acetyl-CoA isomerase